MPTPTTDTLIIFDYQGTLAVQGKVYPGMDIVVRTLSEQYILCIVSASAREYIVKTILQRDLLSCFKEIIGRESLTTKAAAIASLLTEYGVEKTECVFITDTHDDIATAKLLGITPIFVTWGTEPVPDNVDVQVVNNPQEIFSVITKKKEHR